MLPLTDSEEEEIVLIVEFIQQYLKKAERGSGEFIQANHGGNQTTYEATRGKAERASLFQSSAKRQCRRFIKFFPL